MSKKRILSVLFICTFAALLPVSSALAQASTLPVSGKLVHGTLTLNGGEEIQFTVLEGAMFSVRDQDSGLFVGFTPIIEDEATQRVNFTVFEIEEVGPGLQKLNRVENLVAAKALGSTSPSLLPYSELKLRGITDSGLSKAEIEKMREELRVKPNLGPTDEPTNG